MRIQVNVLEAKTRLSELLKAANDGTEVIIANRGRPVGRLVPADFTPSGHRLGSREAVLYSIDHLPDDPTPLADEAIEQHIRQMREEWG